VSAEPFLVPGPFRTSPPPSSIVIYGLWGPVRFFFDSIAILLLVLLPHCTQGPPVVPRLPAWSVLFERPPPIARGWHFFLHSALVPAQVPDFDVSSVQVVLKAVSHPPPTDHLPKFSSNLFRFWCLVLFPSNDSLFGLF